MPVYLLMLKSIGCNLSVQFGGIVTYTRFSDFNAYKKLPLFDHENSQISGQFSYHTFRKSLG
jgi:hypothetical protein